MANKEALRELQSRLAERLQAARSESRTASWLAVELGDRGFLLPLQDAGEIFPVVRCVPVPYTSDWFQGVANLRGGLHGVIDLAAFLGLRKAAQPAGGPAEGLRDTARLVAFNPALEVNCAVLVDRLAGLRNRDQLRRQPEAGRPRPAFAGPSHLDDQGRTWQELSLAALAADEVFLKIAR